MEDQNKLQALLDFANSQAPAKGMPVPPVKKVIIPAKIAAPVAPPESVVDQNEPPNVDPAIDSDSTPVKDHENLIAQSAKDISQARAMGLGRLGDSLKFAGANKETDTQTHLISPQDISSIGGSIRDTPEWKRQAQGLDDLDALTQLEAQRKANKFNVDLSPLGAYLDYQNTLQGRPTNLAASLKGQPAEETSIKDLGDIQRRRADQAKELINTIKAAKLGQLVTQNGEAWNWVLQPPKPTSAIGNERLANTKRQQFTQWADGLYKPSDMQKSAHDTLIAILQKNNPADIGRIPMKRAIADMQGAGRVAVQEMSMEGFSKSFQDTWGRKFQSFKDGTLPEKDIKDLLAAMGTEAEQWETARKNRTKQMKQRAPVYGVSESEVKQLYPEDYQTDSYTRPPTSQDAEALDWAAKNPNDPRAAEILKRNGK